MKLSEFLKVCSDSTIEIYDIDKKLLCAGTEYYKVEKYLSCEITDITTRGYDRLYITITKLVENPTVFRNDDINKFTESLKTRQATKFE